MPTIKKALRLRFACGATGYNEVLKSAGYPAPAISTLQEKLRHICFNPGVLSSVFGYLSAKVYFTFYALRYTRMYYVYVAKFYVLLVSFVGFDSHAGLHI
jgi:hypothetical protein